MKCKPFIINKEETQMKKTMRLVFAPTDGTDGELVLVKKFKNKEMNPEQSRKQ